LPSAFESVGKGIIAKGHVHNDLTVVLLTGGLVLGLVRVSAYCSLETSAYVFMQSSTGFENGT